MTEKRADELQKGDVLDLRGDRWTVVKVKAKGKHVRLTIDGRRGSFTDEVKGRTVYHVVDSSTSRGRVGTGKPGPALIEGVPVEDLEVPFDRTVPWAEVQPADKPLIDRLGARLVGVEVDGGRLVVPPVDDSTLFGHLLTMHSRTWSGVSVAEAKAWAKEHSPGGPESMQDVIDALSLQRAYDLHEELHQDLTAMPHPHWHQERMPV